MNPTSPGLQILFDTCMRRTLFKNEYLDDILPGHKRASI